MAGISNPSDTRHQPHQSKARLEESRAAAPPRPGAAAVYVSLGSPGCHDASRLLTVHLSILGLVFMHDRHMHAKACPPFLGASYEERRLGSAGSIRSRRY